MVDESRDETDETLLGRRASNLRRKSLLEKQQKKREEEQERFEREQAAKGTIGTRQQRRRRRQSVDDSPSLDQVAKRACLASSRRGFPPSVVAALEKSFRSNNYPNDSECVALSETTGLTDKQVDKSFDPIHTF